MSKTFRVRDPDQPMLLQEWLAAGHLVYFQSDIVEWLDLSAIMAAPPCAWPPWSRSLAM